MGMGISQVDKKYKNSASQSYHFSISGKQLRSIFKLQIFHVVFGICAHLLYLSGRMCGQVFRLGKLENYPIFRTI